MYILHTEVEQCEENDYGFLLVPCYIVCYGQFVDIVLAKDILEGEGNGLEIERVVPDGLAVDVDGIPRQFEKIRAGIERDAVDRESPSDVGVEIVSSEEVGGSIKMKVIARQRRGIPVEGVRPKRIRIGASVPCFRGGG